MLVCDSTRGLHERDKQSKDCVVTQARSPLPPPPLLPSSTQSSKSNDKEDLGEKKAHYEKKIARYVRKGDKASEAKARERLAKLIKSMASGGGGGGATPAPPPKRRKEDDDKKPADKREEEKARKTSAVVTHASGARDIDPERPLKEQAIEAILVRWQYAGIDWKPEGCVTPQGFMPLGMVGVFVGVSEEVLGMLRDVRPSAPRPSFEYLGTLPSIKLREMWRDALNNQRKVLIEAEVRRGKGRKAPILLHRPTRQQAHVPSANSDRRSHAAPSAKPIAVGALALAQTLTHSPPPLPLPPSGRGRLSGQAFARRTTHSRKIRP